VLRRHPEAVRGRLVVSGEMANDQMALQVELAGSAPDGLAAQIALSVRDLTKLRCDVQFCALGGLPNDGKVIDDQRRIV
jgi:phenylacetate-CoA ligase